MTDQRTVERRHCSQTNAQRHQQQQQQQHQYAHRQYRQPVDACCDEREMEHPSTPTQPAENRLQRHTHSPPSDLPKRKRRSRSTKAVHATKVDNKDYAFHPKHYSKDHLTTIFNWYDLPSRPGWRMFKDWMAYRIVPATVLVYLLTHSCICAFLAAMFLPCLSIAQGASGMMNYRAKFGDAPAPKVPTHGVVRTVCRNRQGVNHHEAPPTVPGSASALAPEATSPRELNEATPLRLLVIGDSLACGVGQKHCATPILPETIAKQLSKALNGRPVMWTCHGAAGASAGWIVKELDRGAFQQHAPPTTTSKNSSQSPSSETHKSRIANTEAETASTSSSSINDEVSTSDRDDGVVVGTTLPCSSTSASGRLEDRHPDLQADRVDKQTWSERLKEHRIAFDPHYLSLFDIAVVMTGTNDLKSAMFPFLLAGDDAEYRRQAKERGGGYSTELHRIMTSLNVRLRQRAEKFQESVAAVSQRMRGIADPPSTHNNERPPTSIHIDTSESDDSSDNTEPLLPSSSSKWTANRDDNVRKSYQSIAESTIGRTNGGTTAYEKKDHDDSSIGSVSNIRQQRARPALPLVVLPALPSRTLPCFNRLPLRWLSVPTLDIMDSHKRRMAATHEDEVLFVPPPDVQDIVYFLNQNGPYWYDKQSEKTLLNLRDIKRRHAQRLQDEMREYFAKKDLTPSWFDRLTRFLGSPLTMMFSENTDHYSVFAADGAHCNEIGYEFWGRYIGYAIAQEHRRQQHKQTQQS